MNNLAVEVKNFSKRYGSITAVDRISFNVYRGEIFGLLGPNGAGKTTTLECLEGLRRADGGTLKVMGVDPAREQRRLLALIGVQLQTGSLPGYIRVGEAMRLFSAYHGVEPDYALLKRLGLEEQLNVQYHALSTGQKRRLALALAMVHRPAVLFLDEPTAGLDVSTRIALHELMAELRAEGTTILLSTHDLAEAESLSDRVAILLAGKLVAVGTPRELTSAGEGLTKVSVCTSGNSLAGLSLPGVVHKAEQDQYDVFFTASPGPTVAELISRIDSAGDELIDLRVERPSLEERFMELTGKQVMKRDENNGQAWKVRNDQLML
ncbi:MAG TPA: ABC transporter ATP-binding protein [Bacillota bacterium]|nr:ABC transporter ATP-binding protein [Bacillota bacterium]